MGDFKYAAAVILDKDQHYHSVIGNVLGTAGWQTAYEAEGIDFSEKARNIYRTGYDAGTSDIYATGNDHAVFETLFRHMNYDYYNNSIKYCSDAGEPGCQGGDGSHILPSSLYLPSKPSFFGNLPWPPIGPDVNPMTGTIPAKARYEGQSYPYGSGDTTPPAAPTGLRVN